VPAPVPVEAGAASGTPSNSGSTLTLVCRAVNLSNVDPSANTDIAYAVLNALQADPLFDSKQTQLRGDITSEEVTFTFGITVVLKNPLDL
jgi:hypothetical protein